ncbi:hypothetical protein ILUMI_03149 [Ignelater luminosus]|uniref:Methyltransferase type 11 domain-containing protein n=1 Tax=Ignelater luminosus TaxID=2038154 RepID=A0A8K0GKQ6_IGNLU|nr:hypothetical protein ILUMI_03149 [Ignelater luminosus]
MNQAFLYSKYNGLQKNDATFVLKNYFRLVQWKKDGNDAILDIGCGAGDVTNDLLLPFLPKNFGKLVGVDLSEDMVEFARTRYKSSKISFEQMNIEAEDIPVDFEEAFDHVFSFYCLHWIQDQRKALSNILKMLRPGGDMLLTFLASNPIFEIYESLSKSGRWESYMENFKNYVSPYQYSSNPDKELKELLEEVGFQTQVCKVEERIYVYPNAAVLKKSVTAVSPFYNKIPENLQADYLSDYMTEVKRLNLVETKDNNNEQRINVPYKLFIVYASKSL